MFIAMNRFKVIKGEEKSFEQIWASRRARLAEMDGYIAFHLLRGRRRTRIWSKRPSRGAGRSGFRGSRLHPHAESRDDLWAAQGP
jgi:heme-degrading monooxygenase HmoA